MNIALVCDYSLDYLGGAQTAFIDQARALVAAGHRVVVVAPRGRASSVGASAHEWIDARSTLPVLDLPIIRKTTQLRTRIERMLTLEHVDVVHVHSEFGIASAAVDAAAQLGIPVVHTVHTFFWQAALPAFVQKPAACAILRFHGWITGIPQTTARLAEKPVDSALRNMTLAVALKADAVVSPSAHQAARLQDAGLRRVVTVPNTVIITETRPSPLDRIVGPVRVVWVGRCVREKRVLPFIDACLSALAVVPSGSLSIEIVGDGPQRGLATRRAGEHPAIVFSGRLSRERVMRTLSRSHLIALTSCGFDNQPMTVVEALFASRGVLYVDPALTEGLDTAGLLSAGPDIDSMASTLVALVRNPQCIVQASRRASEAFALFAPERFVSEIESIYCGELLQKGKEPHPKVRLPKSVH